MFPHELVVVASPTLETLRVMRIWDPSVPREAARIDTRKSSEARIARTPSDYSVRHASTSQSCELYSAVICIEHPLHWTQPRIFRRALLDLGKQASTGDQRNICRSRSSVSFVRLHSSTRTLLPLKDSGALPKYRSLATDHKDPHQFFAPKELLDE